MTDCNCSLHRLPPKERAGLFDRAIDRANAEVRQTANVFTIRAAIADVLDAGRRLGAVPLSWRFDCSDESEAETERRGEFIDAVVARITELQKLESV